MKLKNILLICFSILTLAPALIITVLLYQSGLELSKESYFKNIKESINVQADYVKQTVEDTMIQNSRFIKQNDLAEILFQSGSEASETALIAAFRTYLDIARDQMMVCLLLDRQNQPLYTIGEKDLLEIVRGQLAPVGTDQTPAVQEFKVDQDVCSLGIVTPIVDEEQQVTGSFVTVYDKKYLFKMISSYYRAVDSVTYIFREGGEPVNYTKSEDGRLDEAIIEALGRISPEVNGRVEVKAGKLGALGYYTRISGTPWYLAGFTADDQVYAFVNSFVWVYLFIIALVFLVDLFLSVWLSRRMVKPVYSLIHVMENYERDMVTDSSGLSLEKSYFEISYLAKKFQSMMNKIVSTQRNLENMYQLYQSIEAVDTNISIDVLNRTVKSNQPQFQELFREGEETSAGRVLESLTQYFSPGNPEQLERIFREIQTTPGASVHELEVCVTELGQQWYHMLVVPMYESDSLSKIFIQLRDISSFKKMELESAMQARRDHLTGLLNRRGFTERVQRILEEEKGDGRYGMLFLDMDHFKSINDHLGHIKGDEVLIQVADTLTASLEREDVIARLGGDEFVVFLSCAGSADIEEKVSELEKKLKYAYPYSKGTLSVTASIGFSIWNEVEHDSFDQLLQRADSAMYRAKNLERQRSSGR